MQRDSVGLVAQGWAEMAQMNLAQLFGLSARIPAYALGS